MQQNIVVQMGNDPRQLILSDQALIDQIHSLVKAHIGDNKIAQPPGATQNFAGVEDMPVTRIFIGPSQDKCPCCGRPYDDQKK